MKKKLSRILLMALLLSGCSTAKNPTRAESNATATTIAQVRSDVQNHAAGINSAIGYTANKLPASREKDVIKLFVDDQVRLLGQPKLQTQTEFEKAAEALLSDNAQERIKGEAQRAKLAGDVEQLKSSLAKLEAKFEEQRKKEEAEHQAQLQRVREEGEQKVMRLIALIFFGGAAVLVAAGIAALVFAQYVPMLGPRVAFGLMVAGGVSGVMGVILTQLLKQLNEHPWLLWTGIGVIVLILSVVGALIYANHHHAKPN